MVPDIILGVLVVLVLDMTLTVGLRGEAEIAQSAFKRLLAGVSTHVLQQDALVRCAVATGANIALKWRTGEVLLVVPLEGPQVGEDGRAPATGELAL